MKKLRYVILSLALLSSAIIAADDTRMVNFKTCVEKSKLGKQEQAAFEALKKQMEGNLAEREKTINEMASKFENTDFLDSLSEDAEVKLKREFRTISQEYSQIQNQYLQALQQTNMKVVQKMTEIVGKASERFASNNKVDFIFNDEAAFYTNPSKDISDQIIAIMDDMYENDASLKEGVVPSLDGKK